MRQHLLQKRNSSCVIPKRLLINHANKVSSHLYVLLSDSHTALLVETKLTRRCYFKQLRQNEMQTQEFTRVLRQVSFVEKALTTLVLLQTIIFPQVIKN